MSERESYLIALSEQLCPLSWDGGLASLSPPEQVFVTIWELEAEVNNGGFTQYYTNSAGDHAERAAQSLETIGAPSMAGIVRRANALFPGGPPRDRDQRSDVLQSLGVELEESLDRLTERFCAYPEDLSELLYRFVRSHCEAIRGA